MSLPPGFLDELRSRTSLAQVVGRKVMWDNRKSNQGKGDMWAPCPFHHEKTASFHVDDRKGYYYCFGCHAKGDAISFVRETENVDFMEAVEILAREAGMPMPARDPRAQEQADRRTELAQVMEQAVQFFRLQLKTGSASAARDYLDRRGMRPETQDKFEIGFAPDGWQNLWDHLKNKGVDDSLILECGLAKPSTREGGRPYDTFRNRIMFPIRDPRGRCIAFGGRAMDPDDNAKYLNSPETLLFDKSRTLYNHGPAREAAGKGLPLIVAEGYMDVIALSEAGFGATVAPLGTAVTEHQLQLLWRIADEPVIALDGDTAGLRAAMRVIDIALPLLEAGRSLRFAIMPEGQDPDDVIRAQGRGAVQALIDKAIPMVDLLWQRETEGRVFDSPERKAALDKALREKIKLIRDPSIRQHYGQAIKELRWQLFSPRRNTTKAVVKKSEEKVTISAKTSMLVSIGSGAEIQKLEAVVLAFLIKHPKLIEDFEDSLVKLPCAPKLHGEVRDALLRANAGALDGHEGSVDVSSLEYAVPKFIGELNPAVNPIARLLADEQKSEETVSDALSKIEAVIGADNEVSEGEESIAKFADETTTWRLAQAAKAKFEVGKKEDADVEEFVRASNGADLNRTELERAREQLELVKNSKPGRKRTQHT